MTLDAQLFETQRAGGPATIAEDDIPGDLNAALDTQIAVLARWRAANEPLGGWKVGFSAGPSRNVVPEAFRPFGFVLQNRIFQSGDEIELGPIWDCRIESELCLVLGAELSGRDVTVEEARAAIRGVAPSFEINSVRVPMNLPLLVADNIAQWGIVVGDEISADGLDLLATQVTMFEGRVQRETVDAAGHLDDPYLSLCRICAQLDRFGLGLTAGQPVITGAFSALPVTEPSTWRAEFGDLGSVTTTFRGSAT